MKKFPSFFGGVSRRGFAAMGMILFVVAVVVLVVALVHLGLIYSRMFRGTDAGRQYFVERQVLGDVIKEAVLAVRGPSARVMTPAEWLAAVELSGSLAVSGTGEEHENLRRQMFGNLRDELDRFARLHPGGAAWFDVLSPVSGSGSPGSGQNGAEASDWWEWPSTGLLAYTGTAWDSSHQSGRLRPPPVALQYTSDMDLPTGGVPLKILNESFAASGHDAIRLLKAGPVIHYGGGRLPVVTRHELVSGESDSSNDFFLSGTWNAYGVPVTNFSLICYGLPSFASVPVETEPGIVPADDRGLVLLGSGTGVASGTVTGTGGWFSSAEFAGGVAYGQRERASLAWDVWEYVFGGSGGMGPWFEWFKPATFHSIVSGSGGARFSPWAAVEESASEPVESKMLREAGRVELSWLAGGSDIMLPYGVVPSGPDRVVVAYDALGVPRPSSLNTWTPGSSYYIGTRFAVNQEYLPVFSATSVWFASGSNKVFPSLPWNRSWGNAPGQEMSGWSSQNWGNVLASVQAGPSAPELPRWLPLNGLVLHSDGVRPYVVDLKPFGVTGMGLEDYPVTIAVMNPSGHPVTVNVYPDNSRPALLYLGGYVNVNLMQGGTPASAFTGGIFLSPYATVKTSGASWPFRVRGSLAYYHEMGYHSGTNAGDLAAARAEMKTAMKNVVVTADQTNNLQIAMARIAPRALMVFPALSVADVEGRPVFSGLGGPQVSGEDVGNPLWTVSGSSGASGMDVFGPDGGGDGGGGPGGGDGGDGQGGGSGTNSYVDSGAGGVAPGDGPGTGYTGTTTGTTPGTGNPPTAPSIVTPLSPSLRYPVGGGLLTIPAVEGVAYTVRGEIMGTYYSEEFAPGDYSLRVWDEFEVSAAAREGYTLEPGAQTRWWFRVISYAYYENPLFYEADDVENPSFGAPAVWLPSGIAVQYEVTVNGNLNGSYWNGGVLIEVPTGAEVEIWVSYETYLHSDSSSENGWRHVFASPDLVTVTPLAPTVVQPDYYGDGGWLTIPEVEGVVYIVEGYIRGDYFFEEFAPGDYSVDVWDGFYVYASAQEGYALSPEAETGWWFEVVYYVYYEDPVFYEVDDPDTPYFGAPAVWLPPAIGVSYEVLVNGDWAGFYWEGDAFIEVPAGAQVEIWVSYDGYLHPDSSSNYLWWHEFAAPGLLWSYPGLQSGIVGLGSSGFSLVTGVSLSYLEPYSVFAVDVMHEGSFYYSGWAYADGEGYVFLDLGFVPVYESPEDFSVLVYDQPAWVACDVAVWGFGDSLRGDYPLYVYNGDIEVFNGEAVWMWDDWDATYYLWEEYPACVYTFYDDAISYYAVYNPDGDLDSILYPGDSFYVYRDNYFWEWEVYAVAAPGYVLEGATHWSVGVWFDDVYW